MRTILLTALCAITIGTQAKVANDTIDKYIIDKQPVEHFDGSQLEGKCISKYMIAYKQGKGVVERHHVIYTGDEAEKTFTIEGDANGPIVISKAVDPLIIVDGKEMTLEEGDSVYFDATKQHGMQALNNAKAKFLAIII